MRDHTPEPRYAGIVQMKKVGWDQPWPYHWKVNYYHDYAMYSGAFITVAEGGEETEDAAWAAAKAAVEEHKAIEAYGQQKAWL